MSILRRITREVFGALRRRSRRVGFDVVRYPPNSMGTLPGYTARLLSELDVELVLDVGANTGQYASLLRDAGFSKRIVSFEPVASSFSTLEAQAAGDSDWSAVCVALGAQDKSATMNVTESSVLSSFRRPSAQGPSWIRPQMQMVRSEEVQMHRLDSIFETLGPVRQVMLKLDTQGWDLEVLRGASGCLDRIVAIQTELSVVPLYDSMPTWLDVVTFLHRLGYEPTYVAPVLRDGPWAIEFDCIMVRRDARSVPDPS